MASVERQEKRHLIGIDESRPAPQPPRRVAIDYDRWHMHVVLYQSTEEALKIEAARGTCDLVVPAVNRRRRGARDTIPRSRRDMSDPIEQAKQLLVSASAATWAILDAMTDDEIRRALEDLRNRIRTAEELAGRQKQADEHEEKGSREK